MPADPRGASEQAVGRRADDEVLQVAALPLGGDRQAPVLDPRSWVHEVGHVLASRAAAGRVPACHTLRPGSVLGQRAPPQQPRQIVARARAFEPESDIAADPT